MKKTFIKVGILVFATFFFQAIFVQASEAEELTPFYKSWLKERSYVHPGLRSKAQSPSAKKMTQSKTKVSANTPKVKSDRFWKSWLKERSYSHPGIVSSAATSTPAKNISKIPAGGKAKSSAPKYKSRPKFNVCNFVCLSTCKTCNKSASSNYLMSKE